jgi:CBS domain containing-hemolysin-like protein
VSPLLMLLLGIVLILVLIVANAYFVAQEFAYMSVDRARLRALSADGDDSAGRALAVTRRTSFMLSGAQLGITVTGLLVGELVEPMIGGSLADMIGVAGATGAIAITTLLVATVVQMVFAELYPKNLAVAAPEPLARALARSTQIYLFLFGWLIAFFDWSSNALLRLVGVTPGRGRRLHCRQQGPGTHRRGLTGVRGPSPGPVHVDRPYPRLPGAHRRARDGATGEARRNGTGHHGG